MALKRDTTLRNSLLTELASLMSSGTMKIYTGSQPSSANDAATGTLLVTITLPASPFTSPSGGSMSKNGTWSGTASATGVAGWARIEGSGGDSFDVDVSESGGGGEAIIDDENISTGGAVTVTAFTYTMGE